MPEGQTALVTGASRGIGRAIAVALARVGFDVAISARTVGRDEPGEYSDSVACSRKLILPGSLEETSALIDESGRRCVAIDMDLTNYASVRSGIRRLLDSCPRIDVIVHNARYVGAGASDRFMDTPFEAYQRFLDVECLSPLIITRALLPAMLERDHGVIVNVTSRASYLAPARSVAEGGWSLAYALAKAGGHALTQVLRVELANTGIRVLNVDPGPVTTERKLYFAKERGQGKPRGASPASVGRAIARLVADPSGDFFGSPFVDVQDLMSAAGAPEL
jgi:NAD(P)-dependent dehydrogenase (short-subunit alcohol dehydrogenase family)